MPELDPNFLTNSDATLKPIYEAAIAESGFSEIYIGEPVLSGELYGYIGIWCTSRTRSFSPFWRIFERLKEGAVKNANNKAES